MPDDITDVEELQEEPAVTAAPADEKFIDLNTPLAPKPAVAPPKEEEDPEAVAEPNAEDEPPADDKLANQSFADILEGIGEEPPKPAPEDDETIPDKPDSAKVESDPADQKATASPSTPAPAVPKKVVKFELPSEFSEEPAAAAPAPAKPAPAKPADTAADPDADYISSLDESVREEIEMASAAERILGDKYSGHRKKLVGWLKGMDAEIERLRKENPERSFGADDSEYQSRLAELRKQKPAITRADEREMERRIVRSEVKEEVLQELSPQITEVARQTRAIELKPKVAATAQKFSEHVSNMVSGHSEVMKPIMAEVAKLGDKARDTYGLELDIIEDRTGAAKELMSEYLMVKNGGAKLDPRNLTKTQSELNQFLVDQGNGFLKTGGKKLVDSQGRKFLPNHQMNALHRQVRDGVVDQAELSKHWTFNDEMILGMLALKAVVEIEAEVKYENERSKKYGFERKLKVAAAEPVKPDPDPTPTPKSKPRASIGGGQRSDKKVSGEDQISSMVGELGLE